MGVRGRAANLPRPLGPYTLLRRLAVGGMAEVYVAKAKGIGGFEKLVAIKVIHPRFSEDEHFVQMMVEEAKLSVLLTHANIAQTFDLGCIDGTYFIVMEFIDGADVYKLLKRAADKPARVPLDLCAFIVAEVCQGLDYAHNKRDMTGAPLSIVHRDISPQNILLSFAGEVKIVDFGIAKAAMRSGQTEVGVIKGKYYYMSPEQAWADPVDHRSDIFSLGIVLHELLTGKLLYDEDNLPRLLDRVRKADIAPPSRQRADIPPALDAIVMKALAKYPAERYPSAHEFGQALTRFLYQERPGFTAVRLSGMMSQLFPDELAESTQSVRLPEGKVLSSIHTADEKVAPRKTEPGSGTLDPMKPEEFRPDPVKSVIFDLGFADETTSREIPTAPLPKKPTRRGRPPEPDSTEDEPTMVASKLRFNDPTDPEPGAAASAPDDEGWEDPTVIDADGDILARMREMLERKVAAERKKGAPPPPPPTPDQMKARESDLPHPPPPPAPLMDARTAQSGAPVPSWPAPPSKASHSAIPDLSTGVWEESGPPAPSVSDIPPAFTPSSAPSLQETYPMKRPRSRGLLVAAVVLAGTVVGIGVGLALRSDPPPPRASVRVVSRPPGAEVRLDGQPVGTTPVTVEDVAPGTHELELALAGHEGASRSVGVASAPVEVPFTLRPLRRDLVLDSDPPDRAVTVDGAAHGRTPVTLRAIAYGRVVRATVAFEGGEVRREIRIDEETPERVVVTAD